MWPAIIGAAASIGSALLNKNSADNSSKKNAELQREFAQNSISWRVQDAKNAGIHPLYALGASTVSAQPSYIGSNYDFGQAFESVARGYMDRNFNKTMQTQTLQKNNLELENLRLQNERIKTDTELARKMGQNVFTTGVKSQIPYTGSNSVFTDNTVGGVSNEFNSRWSVSKNANGDWQKTPTNDFADLMSEGYVVPAREYIRDLNYSYQKKVADDLTKSMHKSGDLPKNKRLIPRYDFSGIIPEVVYKEVGNSLPRGLPKGEYERTPRSFRFGGLR